MAITTPEQFQAAHDRWRSLAMLAGVYDPPPRETALLFRLDRTMERSPFEMDDDGNVIRKDGKS